MTRGIAEAIDVRFSFATPKDALTLKGWASFKASLKEQATLLHAVSVDTFTLGDETHFLACFIQSTDAVQFTAALKELLGCDQPVYLNRKA
jgi:hypothetical protein